MGRRGLFGLARKSASNGGRKAKRTALLGAAEALEGRSLLSGLPSFAAAANYPVGSDPFSMVATDFNRDGKPDLAVAGIGDTIQVLLNSGDGTFVTQRAYSTDYRSWLLLAAADFNGDGDPDIAVADSLGSVMLLLNDGHANFVLRGQYPVSDPNAITAGDFNGDGKMDLAVAAAGGTVGVLLNNGDGFAAKADYPAGKWPSAIASADFNGDGKLDIAVSNAGSGTISVLLGKGDGTFAPKQDYDGGKILSFLITADFNRDGKIDLAAVSNEKHTLSVLLGRGDGSFSPKVDYRVGLGPHTVAAADMNGDRNIDLVIDGNPAGILLGRGDGTFARAVGFATGTNLGALCAVAADFNADGKPDLAVGNAGQISGDARPQEGSVSILLNAEDRPPTRIALSNNTVPDRQLGGVLVGGFHTQDPDAATTFRYALVSGPGDRDNALFKIHGVQLKTRVPLDPRSGRRYSIRVRSTDAGGLYIERAFTIRLMPATLLPRSEYDTGYVPMSSAAADFDGDGKLDLAVANAGDNTVSILPNLGDGTFGPRRNYRIGRKPKSSGVSQVSIATADFNNDGKIDLAVANGNDQSIKVLLNRGDGSFYRQLTVAHGHPWSSLDVTVADLNGDGKMDLIVPDGGSDTVSVLLGRGDGSFTPRADYAAGEMPGPVLAVDLNGDGKIDLASATDSGFSILLGHGDGSFAPKVDYALSSSPISVVAADFNRDGKIDLALGAYGDNVMHVALGRGDGTFYLVPDCLVDGNPDGLAAADFNGDGKIDVAMPGPRDDTVSVLLGRGDGTFTSKLDYALAEGPAAFLTAADFNGDGKADLVADDTSYTVSVFPSPVRQPALRANAALLWHGNSLPVQSDAPDAIDFGAVRLGREGRVYVFQVTNAGRRPLEMGDIEVSKGFRLLRGLPKRLAVGQSARFKVQFVGESVGAWWGKLEFPTNDPLRNPFVIRLTGTVKPSPKG